MSGNLSHVCTKLLIQKSSFFGRPFTLSVQFSKPQLMLSLTNVRTIIKMGGIPMATLNHSYHLSTGLSELSMARDKKLGSEEGYGGPRHS